MCVVISIVKQPDLKVVDVIFFFLNAIVYTAFNVIFWVYNPFWPNSDVCHNEDRFDINCKT